MVTLQTDFDGDLENFGEFSEQEIDQLRSEVTTRIREAMSNDPNNPQFTILRDNGIVESSLSDVVSGDVILYIPEDEDQFINNTDVSSFALSQYFAAGYSIGVKVE
jgi:hypothetical protein